MWQNLHVYFYNNTKNTQKFANWSTLWKHQVNNFLWKLKLDNFLWIIFPRKTSVESIQNHGFEYASRCYHNLCDMKVMFGLFCLMTMLEGLKEFIKISPSWKCFVCDFTSTISYLKLFYIFGVILILLTWMTCWVYIGTCWMRHQMLWCLNGDLI
jgi:hypothetical protein